MKKYLPFLLLPLFFYILGSWDIDGLRQGTETFYLKVAKEMFDSSNFVTPLHRGVPHWSKPPFVYWISFPFYYIFGFSHHFAARLSLIFLTFLTTFFITKEHSLNSKSDWRSLFLILITSFGFFRYGKIFMMDIPLATLTTLSALLFFNSQVHNQSKKFYWSILVLALSILVKGPISLVMVGGSFALFGIISPKNRTSRFLINGSLYLFSGVCLASIWFVICYLEHGQEFIQYFFYRENLGKFASESYPVRKLFQGLFLYGLPWTFVLFYLVKKIKSFNFSSFAQNQYLSFTTSSFLVYFFIWFIPNQRSHHYAIPALPFFLILLNEHIIKKGTKFIPIVIGCLFSLLGILGLFAGSLMYEESGLLPILASLIIIGLIFLSLNKRDSFNTQALTFLAGFSLFWSVLLPSFSLPKLPGKAVNLIAETKVFTVFKKNYYYEQVLGRKIQSLHRNETAQHISNHNYLYIVTEEHLNSLKNQIELNILHKWPVWKRRVKFPLIKVAIQARDIAKLQENYYLIEASALD